MKLISMTDFVLEQEIRSQRNNYPCESDEYFNKCVNYAKFLKQPLNLGMFYPCDGNGDLLSNVASDNNYYGIHLYNEAEKQVLFNFDGGLKLIRNKDNFFIIEDKNGVYIRVLKNKTKLTVESLFKFSVDIKLTENAIKKYNLK